jgi:hypothetical protein
MSRLAGRSTASSAWIPIATLLQPQQWIRSVGACPDVCRCGCGGVSAAPRVWRGAGSWTPLLGGRRRWQLRHGLAVFLRAQGERVVEVGRPKRPPRRMGAKNDTLDAVRARQLLKLLERHNRAAVAVIRT